MGLRALRQLMPTLVELCGRRSWPRHRMALVVLFPSSWSPANLDETKLRACRFWILQANKRQLCVCVGGGQGSGLVPGWCRQVLCPRDPAHKRGSGEVTSNGVSVRVMLLFRLEQGAGPTRSGNEL